MNRSESVVVSMTVLAFALCTAGCSRKPEAAKAKPDASDVANVVMALNSSTPKAISVSADGSVVLAACDSAAHDAGSAPGLYVSRDCGATWATNRLEQLWRGAAMSSDGKYMAASAARNAGVWVSSDYGSTWARTHEKSSWALAMSADGRILVSGGDFGPLDMSSDCGQTWATVLSSNLFWTGAAVSADGRKIAAVASHGAKRLLHPVFESADGGATWSTHETPRLWTAIRMSADGAQQVAVASTADAWTSADGGATWQARKQGNQHASRIAMSGDGMRIVTGAEGGNQVISYSSDGGKTWKDSPLRKPTFAFGMSADGAHIYCGDLRMNRLDLSF